MMKKSKYCITDLAIEAVEGIDGVIIGKKNTIRGKCGDFLTDEIEIITEEAARRFGKARGRYVTITSPLRLWELDPNDALMLSDIISIELRSLSDTPKRVLTVGLGNSAITVDSLGVRTAELVSPTRHPGKEDGVCTIIAGVAEATGITAAELLRPLAKELKFDTVVLIDSLAAGRVQSLGRTVQISDTGIRPGSGLGKRKYSISSDSVGCPLLSMGVPTVIRAENLLIDEKSNAAFPSELVLGAVDCDILVESAARILSAAIEKAFTN